MGWGPARDRQGSVYAQTDASGNPSLWIAYSAYGEPLLHDGSGRLLGPAAGFSSFGYHGLPHDFALGVVDMRARTYVPTLGRFASPDPIALAGGSNLFAFVSSAPLAFRDPLGLRANATGTWPQWKEPSFTDDLQEAGGAVVSAYGSRIEGQIDGVAAFAEDAWDGFERNATCVAQGGYCIGKRLWNLPGTLENTWRTAKAVPGAVSAAASDPVSFFCRGNCAYQLGKAEGYTAAAILSGKAPEYIIKTLNSIRNILRLIDEARLARGGSGLGSALFKNAKNRAIAEYLEQLGRRVLPNRLEEVPNMGRQGDALVDGELTEFKTLDPGARSGTVRNTVNESVSRGGQAREIIIDARGSGLTEAEARSGAGRALGIARGNLDGLTILGDGYFFRWVPRT